jgi:hypothetical protein
MYQSILTSFLFKVSGLPKFALKMNYEWVGDRSGGKGAAYPFRLSHLKILCICPPPLHQVGIFLCPHPPCGFAINDPITLSRSCGRGSLVYLRFIPHIWGRRLRTETWQITHLPGLGKKIFPITVYSNTRLTKGFAGRPIITPGPHPLQGPSQW